MAKPTRFPNGITTASKSSTLGTFIGGDPTNAHVYFNDFDTYVAGDWTVTETDTNATEALTDADGGVLLITNTTTDNDLVAMQKVGESFLMESGKKAYFKARFKVGDVDQSDIVMGLQITDTTPLDVTDGIFFQSDDGDANLDFHVEKDNTATSATAVATLADDTWITVGFEYNGVDAVEYYVNDVKKGTAAVTNLPDDEELTVSFALQNGEGDSTTMSIDYVFAAKER